MEKRTFCSSAWASGRWWFPHTLILEDHQITYRKRRWFGSTEISIPYSQIASVRLEHGLFFTRIIIETSGSERIDVPGFWRHNANQIKKWIDEKKRTN